MPNGCLTPHPSTALPRSRGTMRYPLDADADICISESPSRAVWTRMRQASTAVPLTSSAGPRARGGSDEAMTAARPCRSNSYPGARASRGRSRTRSVAAPRSRQRGHRPDRTSSYVVDAAVGRTLRADKGLGRRDSGHPAVRATCCARCFVRRRRPGSRICAALMAESPAPAS
jgi:hypothetical protein